ncbi:MAG: ABC transporter ATP-binding protein [Bacillota bacterium]
MRLLEAEKVTKRFSGLVAVRDVDMHVDEGETVGLIGPNGAGKTTLFNCLSGFYPPTFGKVFFMGKEITGKPSNYICRQGLARTFQIVRSFLGMTVLENVMVGAFKNTSNSGQAQEKAQEVLEFCALHEKRAQQVNELTIADKKRLEVARALATSPKLLMLDEAMAGLNPSERKEAVRLIERIRDSGVTVFLIEHVMDVIMPISDRIVVLNYGNKIAEGTPQEVSRNQEVLTAYLGAKYRAKSV